MVVATVISNSSVSVVGFGIVVGGVASDGVECVVMKKHRLFNVSSCSPNSDCNVEKELSKRNTR